MKKKLIVFLILSLLLPFVSSAKNDFATVFNPNTGHRKVVIVGDKTAFDGGYLLEVARVINNENNLGFSVITDYGASLSSSITKTQSTIPVTSVSTRDGHTITMADLGSKVFLVIEPSGSKEEIVMCTGISALNWTGCTRGLAFYGTSTASISANTQTHTSGAKIILSNAHYIYEELVDRDSNETVGGNKTFTGNIVVGGSLSASGTIAFEYLPTATSTAPTLDEQLANKKYVDDVFVSGAPDSTSGVKGIVQLATTTSPSTIGKKLGSTGARLVLPAEMASSTSQAKVMIPVTNSSGKISQGFLDLTEDFSFSSTTIEDARIGTSTFINLPIVSTTTLPTEGKVVFITDGDKLPAVDGSNLTNINEIDTLSSLTVRTSNDNVTNDLEANAGVFQKKKEIRIDETILGETKTVTAVFTLERGSGTTVQGAIYKNGVIVGSVEHTSDTLVISRNISGLVAGDLLQVYAHNVQNGEYVKTYNFRLQYDYAVTKMNGLTISTPIPTNKVYATTNTL